MFLLGLSRIYDTRDEPLERAIACSTYNSEGDRSNGQYNSQKIQCNSNAVETKHMRGSHDIKVSFPGCKVRAQMI